MSKQEISSGSPWKGTAAEVSATLYVINTIGEIPTGEQARQTDIVALSRLIQTSVLSMNQNERPATLEGWLTLL